MNHCAQHCASGLFRLLLVSAIAWLSLPLPQVAAQVGVQVSLHLDADSVELIRALRRAQGLDPPDAQADQRVAALLQRRQAEKSQSAQSKTTALAAADAAKPAAQPTVAVLAEAALASQLFVPPALDTTAAAAAQRGVSAPLQAAPPVEATVVSVAAAQIAPLAPARTAAFMQRRAASPSTALLPAAAQPALFTQTAATVDAAATTESAATAVEIMSTLLTQAAAAAADASLEAVPEQAAAQVDRPHAADLRSPPVDQPAPAAGSSLLLPDQPSPLPRP